MSLLQVSNVTRRFGDLIAVDTVSMTVEKGELRAVIGPNGAGKTTFFNLISGFLTPSSGRILFDGEDVTGMLPARRAWGRVASTLPRTEAVPRRTRRDHPRTPPFRGGDTRPRGGVAGAVGAP